MLPDDGQFSSSPVPSVFTGGRALPVRDVVDYELGGVALNDASQGLMLQMWRAQIVDDNKIVLDAQNVPEATIINGINITEVSFSFDRNMNPAVAYVEDGVAKLYWYDSTLPGMTTTVYPDIVTPRLSHDDKRDLQSAISDVIFAYLRNEGGENRVFYRQQRDRYTIEYDPTAALEPSIRDDYRAQVAASPGLIKIGMSRQNRFQFMFRNPE